MKLITRKIEEKDWDTLCEWWNGISFLVPLKSLTRQWYGWING